MKERALPTICKGKRGTVQPTPQLKPPLPEFTDSLTPALGELLHLCSAGRQLIVPTGRHPWSYRRSCGETGHEEQKAPRDLQPFN